MNRPIRPQISLLLLALLIACLVAGNALAAKQNTVFLPLKINAEDSGALAQQADAGALQAALSGKSLVMLPRSEAEQHVDYKGTWPPPATALTKALEKNGMDYAAVGSLTVIGRRISVDMQIIDLLEPGKSQSAFKEGASAAELPSYGESCSLTCSVAPVKR